MSGSERVCRKLRHIRGLAAEAAACTTIIVLIMSSPCIPQEVLDVEQVLEEQQGLELNHANVETVS